MDDSARVFNTRILLPLLASIVAITPLAIDMYLPAMLVIANSLGTSMPQVQLSLSIYLAGYALGMLVYGPLADQLGRRKLALFGLGGFALSSFLLAFSSDILHLWGLRATQAFTGAAATVVVPGIIRHIYQANTAKGMSYVSMIMMLAPLVAPSVGSAILGLASWQWIFLTLASYALVVMVLAYLYLVEVPIYKSDKRGLHLFFDSYATVLSNRAALPDIASSMLVSFGFFCFLTSAPFIYLDYFDVSEQLFGVLFAFNVVALMLGSFANTRLVPKLGSRKMLYLGLGLGVASATALLVFSLFDLSLYYMVFSIAPLMMSLGIIAANADALILLEFEKNSGTATAVIGTLRFGSGALVGLLLALLHADNTLPFAGIMFAAILLTAMVQYGRFRQYKGCPELDN
ncbi:Bcr/CflA family efflux MFS transporter [Pseudoalteromonas rubra]|uniref:Bcr/CflA family efflux MFS transporter n=1 Tax=Pseudoalteromonas rubra TaxID=43658 RepID=UPI002DB59C6D|nr:Bcr/CflA family efflux MFS transporter [Pseudoalteromonas rubra]MEC4088798.1 Bcr/CflA family efflux MFS transporter [Pseudoalteromonas rubra]